MRITYVTESTELWGGIYVIFQHLELLVKMGHDAFLTTLGSEPDWHPLKVPVYQVPRMDSDSIPSADIIVATYWSTVRPVVESRKGIPVHLCQGYEGDFKELQSQKSDIDMVYSYNIPKLIVSPHLDGFLSRRFNAETHYIGQMIDKDLFYPPPEMRNDVTNRPFAILVVGPFESDFKNIAAALMGIKIAKKKLKAPVKLIRISQLPLSNEERKILTPDVYHFHVPHNEMGEIYREANLYVSMSKEAEGFGLPAVEAMACGVPTILSRVSSYMGFDETTDYSFFVDESDPESLAHAIVEIFESRALREKLAHRGKIVAAKFSEENLIRRLTESFATILDRDGSGSIEESRKK
ncbi:MAG: glycosyltransferase family 4 protein [Desulfobacteraceae bacterium]|nr:glycosyltransferase family 4 protein [Desulfobacteraceae bacterium]